MTDDTIINFPDPRAEKSYWVCGCGCMTHYALATGEIECASCGYIPRPSCDGIYLHKPNGIIREMGNIPVMPFTVTDNGAFSRQRWAKRVGAGEFVVLIGVRMDGLVATSCFEDDVLETPEQKSWLREKMRDAYRLLTRPAHRPAP